MKNINIKNFIAKHYKWIIIAVLIVVLMGGLIAMTVDVLEKQFFNKPKPEENLGEQGENEQTPDENIEENLILLKGSGTKSEPYLISSVQDLLEFNEHYYNYHLLLDNNIGYIALDCDLDLDGMDWNPIGGEADDGTGYFGGSFDGRGHTISNFNIVTEGSLFVGFFKETWESADQGAIIENLNLTGVKITSYNEHNSVGALVGLCSTQINNCTTSADITLYNKCENVGGIVGLADCSVNNCKSFGSITSYVAEIKEDNEGYSCKYGGIAGVGMLGNKSSNLTNNMEINVILKQDNINCDNEMFYCVGGVVGSLQGQTTYSNFVNNANVNGVGYVGGVVGDMWNEACTLTNSQNYGDVYGTSGTMLAVGGVVGTAMYKQGDCHIINCLNKGNISGKSVEDNIGIVHASWGGGILGIGHVDVNACVSTGDISFEGPSTNYIGGLVGGCNGTLRNSYCTGSITVLTEQIVCGGVVGILQESIGVTVENCYFIGDIINTTTKEDVSCGGIMGFNMRSDSTTIKNNYYTTDNLTNKQLKWYGWLGDPAQTEGTLISNNASLDTTTLQNSNPNGFIEHQQNQTNPNAVWIFEPNHYPKLYWEV